MSVTIQLLVTNNPANKIVKSSANICQSDPVCVLKDNCSIMDPVLVLDISAITFDTGYNVFDCNYIYIAEFSRYYHVKDIKTLSEKLVEISCHVDVLMSFASGILASPCIVAKNENSFNLYLNDPNYKCYQDDIILMNTFSSGFPNGTDSRFVVTVFGSKRGLYPGPTE